MKQYLGRSIDWRIFVISVVVALTCACGATEALCRVEYSPPSGRGPIVILLSGVDGPAAYARYAAEVAQLGYYAVLLDGNSVQLTQDDEGNLRRAIERAQHSPKALPGKAAVIGFSLGGGGALALAAHMPDLVSAVVAYYPSTRRVLDM